MVLLRQAASDCAADILNTAVYPMLPASASGPGSRAASAALTLASRVVVAVRELADPAHEPVVDILGLGLGRHMRQPRKVRCPRPLHRVRN